MRSVNENQKNPEKIQEESFDTLTLELDPALCHPSQDQRCNMCPLAAQLAWNAGYRVIPLLHCLCIGSATARFSPPRSGRVSLSSLRRCLAFQQQGYFCHTSLTRTPPPIRVSLTSPLPPLFSLSSLKTT